MIGFKRDYTNTVKSQPFFFDENIFDEDLPLSEEERAQVPEFSREEMEAARRQAYEEGKSAGLQESLESMNHTTLTLLKKIEQDVGVLFAAEEKRRKDYEENATLLAAEIFKKAFPTYMSTHGINELSLAIADSLSDYLVPDDIQIELNDSVFTPVSKLLEEHAEMLNKRIAFKSTPSLPEYACRISWPGGGLLCDRSAINEKIFNILHQSLADRGFSLHDNTHADGSHEALAEDMRASGEKSTSGESIDE